MGQASFFSPIKVFPLDTFLNGELLNQNVRFEDLSTCFHFVAMDNFGNVWGHFSKKKNTQKTNGCTAFIISSAGQSATVAGWLAVVISLDVRMVFQGCFHLCFFDSPTFILKLDHLHTKLSLFTFGEAWLCLLNFSTREQRLHGRPNRNVDSAKRSDPPDWTTRSRKIPELKYEKDRQGPEGKPTRWAPGQIPSKYLRQVSKTTYDNMCPRAHRASASVDLLQTRLEGSRFIYPGSVEIWGFTPWRLDYSDYFCMAE